MSQANPVVTGDQTFSFRQSEALLRNVLENAAVGMILVGMDGRLIYANRAFGEMLGYTPDECIGMPVIDFVHPDDVTAATEALRPLMAGKIEKYRAERRCRRKDGSTFWVLSTPALVRDEDTGTPRCLTVQVTDIDKQKTVETALAASESRWNFALESAGQGVWDSDLTTGKMFYSRMWKVMRGFRPDEDVDGAVESWMKRVHPHDRERILEIISRQNSGEIAFNSFEYRERHRDGHWVWILSRGRPVAWLPDGTPARMIGTDTDVTSLKAVQAELAEEKERLRVTLNSIGDGVISTDARGRITFMNPVAEQMTGWQSSEAIGQRVEEVFAVVDEVTDEPTLSSVAECLARDELYYLDGAAVLVGRSGERRSVRDSAAPVRTPQGELIGAVLVFQDITHARALQKELAHSAMHDGLTGLPNRTAFERALSDATNQTRRELREHALCFVDIDRFKQVNDTAGHAAGDALLQQIGHAIRRACRSQDFTARIGGDEFAMVLADCSLNGARKVAQQVIDAISAIRFTWHGKTYEIGASVGITAITSTSPGAAELMMEADAACYAAKAAGRNRVSVFDGIGDGPERFAKSA